MDTFTKLRSLQSQLDNLKRKVLCACSKPTVPPLPTANGSYILTVTDGVYTWTAP